MGHSTVSESSARCLLRPWVLPGLLGAASRLLAQHEPAVHARSEGSVRAQSPVGTHVSHLAYPKSSAWPPSCSPWLPMLLFQGGSAPARRLQLLRAEEAIRSSAKGPSDASSCGRCSSCWGADVHKNPSLLPSRLSACPSRWRQNFLGTHLILGGHPEPFRHLQEPPWIPHRDHFQHSGCHSTSLGFSSG